MMSWFGVRWDEWFTLAMLVFTVGAPLFFLIYFYRRHFLDSPDCSKYTMFELDPDRRPGEGPSSPASCQPGYLQARPWVKSVNSSWFWVTVGIGVIYVLMILVAFIASRGIPELRQAIPM